MRRSVTGSDTDASDAVVNFRSVTAVLAYVFGGMLAIFLTPLVLPLVGFLNRRSSPSA